MKSALPRTGGMMSMIYDAEDQTFSNPVMSSLKEKRTVGLVEYIKSG